MKSIINSNSTKANTFNNQSSLLMKKKRRRELLQRISIPDFEKTSLSSFFLSKKLPEITVSFFERKINIDKTYQIKSSLF